MKKTTDIINTINFDLITDNLKKECLNLEAKCFEALKDFDKAYKSFEEMNSLAKKSDEYAQCNPESYLEEKKKSARKTEI